MTLTPPEDGETLYRYLRRRGQLEVGEALRIAIDIANEILPHHMLGRVHGCLRPECVLFKQGRTVLLDWGAAWVMAGQRTRAYKRLLGQVLYGAPEYLAPERISDPWCLDHRSDQYSLGCVLFEMLTGEPPFTGRARDAVMAKQLRQRLPSLNVVLPDVSRDLEALIERALQKNPEHRFSDLISFVEALKAAIPG